MRRPGCGSIPARKPKGINSNKFLHSLRRTWLVGVLAGLVIAATTCGALWLLVPESYEAFGLLRVKVLREGTDVGPHARL